MTKDNCDGAEAKSAPLSQCARDILNARPRAWEHLLLTQVYADEIAKIDAQNAQLLTQPNITNVQGSVEGLCDLSQSLKLAAQQLLDHLASFRAILNEPLQKAVGAVGVPGDSEKIIAVAHELATVYSQLLTFKRSLQLQERIYDDSIPPSVATLFEEVVIDTNAYLTMEANRLIMTFKKYGTCALQELKEVSKQLTSGQPPTSKVEINYRHEFAPFDTARIETLTKIIEYAAAERDGTETKAGFLYLLVNRSMPGIVKIGHTRRNAEQRIRELSMATGVPTPFEMVLDLFVQDSAEAERIAHKLLEEKRVASNREFFQVSTSTAIKVMYDAVKAVDEGNYDALS